MVGSTLSVYASEAEPDPAETAVWSPIDQINAYRFLAGVPPASINPSLAQSAAGQVDYYDMNRSDGTMAGMGLHQQHEGAAGFTGTTMGSRAKAAGYGAGAVTENAGFGGLTTAIDWAMNTVNHRLPLIHPDAVDMGVSASDQTGFNIIDVGLRRGSVKQGLPSVYPGDGATGVPTSWDGGETPDPAPGFRRPLGYPITVAFSVNQKVEWRGFELWGPDGQQLEITTPKTDWMRAAAIVPVRPLQRGQTYLVWVKAAVDGKVVEKEWQFTTAE
jgi:hypothetical protein